MAMKKLSIVAGTVLFLLMLCFWYVVVYKKMVLRDKASGRILLGYDAVLNRVVVNEYPAYDPDDGPYVFFRDSYAVLIWGVYGDGGKIMCDTLSIPQVYSRSFTVYAGKGTPAFAVNLQPTVLPAPAVYDTPERLVALSDMGRDFADFTQMLMANGVIDRNLVWTFGRGHLVLYGDFMNRRHDISACLWLVYSLEEQAQRDGGCVHLVFDHRTLTNRQGYDPYAPGRQLRLADAPGVRYEDLYGPDTELGRWLRTRNAIERIGDTVFVHGGIKKTAAGEDLWPVKKDGEILVAL